MHTLNVVPWKKKNDNSIPPIIRDVIHNKEIAESGGAEEDLNILKPLGLEVDPDEWRAAAAWSRAEQIEKIYKRAENANRQGDQDAERQALVELETLRQKCRR